MGPEVGLCGPGLQESWEEEEMEGEDGVPGTHTTNASNLCSTGESENT